MKHIFRLLGASSQVTRTKLTAYCDPRGGETEHILLRVISYLLLNRSFRLQNRWVEGRLDGWWIALCRCACIHIYDLLNKIKRIYFKQNFKFTNED